MNPERRAENPGILLVSILPDMVRDDHDRGRTLSLIVVREHASDEWLLVEHRKRVGADTRAKYLLRQPAVVADVHHLVRDRSQVNKRAALPAQVFEVGMG